MPIWTTSSFLCGQAADGRLKKIFPLLGNPIFASNPSFDLNFKELLNSRYYLYPLEDWMYTKDTSIERLLKQFDTNSLKGFGVDKLELGNIAAGAILQYLDLTHHTDLKHITKINRIEQDYF